MQADAKPNALLAFETLGEYLRENDWHPHRLEDRYIYRVGFSGANGKYACYAQIRVDLEQFIFYVMVPIKAPEEKRLACAEFVTRVNYGLRIGNFELDLSDGEVRYKSSLDFENETLTYNLIEVAIYPAVKTTDRYLPGLMKVIYGAVGPRVAIEEIEG
ncbi:MAG: YbjN domain-containing protein [Anaerolineae bacterium]|nr:YbjN domain-containing protein [Anaerolineae bacterium]